MFFHPALSSQMFQMILYLDFPLSLSDSISHFPPLLYKEFPLNMNTVDYLKKYQAVPQEELEQMIVFPGSKKAESSQAAD